MQDPAQHRAGTDLTPTKRGCTTRDRAASTKPITNVGDFHVHVIKELSEGLGDTEVVTVYSDPNEDESQSQITQNCGLVHGRLSPERLDGSKIAKKFKHWCYMHHEHIRYWSPSVAYYGCDARVMVPIESQTPGA